MKKGKRIISVLLVTLLFFSAVSVADFQSLLLVLQTSAAETPAVIYFGDVNEDGTVSANDARLILRYAVQLESFTDRQTQIADMDQNGDINSSDARTALRTAVELESKIVFESNYITQGEYIALLMNTLGLFGFEEDAFFENVPTDHIYFKEIQSAVEWNILEENTFEPDMSATIDFVITKALKALEKEGSFAESDLIVTQTDKNAFCKVDMAQQIVDNAKLLKLNTDPGEDFENIIIKETVNTYSASEAIAKNSDTYIFDIGERPATGDIFIAENNGRQVAEKIVAVTQNADGSFTVQAEQPAMDEVFDDFSFRASIDAQTENIEFTPAENVFVINKAAAANEESFINRVGASEEKVLFETTLRINSSNDPNISSELAVKTSSDYTDALNSEYANQVPSMKELLENYNELINGPGTDNKTLNTKKIVKYEAGWSFDVDIKVSNLAIDLDFSDFWKKGNYEIELSADLDCTSEFKGIFNAQIKLGSFPVPLGWVDWFMDMDVDLFLYFDAEGDAKLIGQGKISQSYGNFDGKTDSLSNDTFTATFEANIDAQGGLNIVPSVSALGFDLAAMSIKIGAHADASVKATPLVEYKEKWYYYAGDFFDTPPEVKPIIFACMSASISYPIITISVSAGEDAKKQIEKLKKKNPGIDIPTEHTFEIFTLSEKSLFKPNTKKIHTENTTDGIKKVEKCTADDYETLAHRCSGYAVNSENNEPLAGATATLLDKDGTIISTAVTNADGTFDFYFIPFGTYSVCLQTAEFDAETETEITIEKNETNVGKISFYIKEQTTDAPALTPEEAVDIYLDNYSLWRAGDTSFSNYYFYGFLDLDFDGILEMVTSVNAGTGYYSTNAYYKIDLNTNTVKEISNSEKKSDGGGFDLRDYTVLYRNNQTETLTYYSGDRLREGTALSAVHYGPLWCENNTVYSEWPFCITHMRENASSQFEQSYSLNGTSISTTEYEALVNNFENENTNLNLQWTPCTGADLDQATTEQKKELLLAAYKSFQYDGFSFDNDITDKSTATVAALSEIWTDVIRDADLLVAYGTTSSEEVACYFTSPADFDLSDTERVSAVFQISVENAAKVTEIGYVMHTMNANILTVAAYALAEGIDAVVFANSIKEEIAATQWIMGMPDQILVAVTDSAVIAAFGTRDIITAFYNVLSVNNTVIIEDINCIIALPLN